MKPPKKFPGAAVADPPEKFEPAVRDARKNLRAASRERKKRERLEKRRFTAHNRKRRQRILAVLLVVAGLAGFVSIGVFTPIMAVRTIEVHGSNLLAEEDVKIAMQPLMGTPIALVRDADVVELLREFKVIERYSTQLIPPDTLSVVLVERTQLLAVKKDDNLVIVDGAGVVLDSVAATERPGSIPVVTGDSALIGSAEFRAAATVVQAMPETLREQISEVTAVSSLSVSLKLVSGVEVHWGEPKQNAFKAVVLEAMLTALGDKKIKLIDVSSPNAPVFQ